MLNWLMGQLPEVKRLRKLRGQLVDECLRLNESVNRARAQIQRLRESCQSEIARNLRAAGASDDVSANRAKTIIDCIQWTAAKGLTAANQRPVSGTVDIGVALGQARQRSQESGQ